MGHQVVHCNVLAVCLLVHKPADVLRQPVTVEVEVILQGGEEQKEGGEGGKEDQFEIMNELRMVNL